MKARGLLNSPLSWAGEMERAEWNRRRSGVSKLPFRLRMSAYQFPKQMHTSAIGTVKGKAASVVRPCVFINEKSPKPGDALQHLLQVLFAWFECFSALLWSLGCWCCYFFCLCCPWPHSPSLLLNRLAAEAHGIRVAGIHDVGRCTEAVTKIIRALPVSQI